MEYFLFTYLLLFASKCINYSSALESVCVLSTAQVVLRAVRGRDATLPCGLGKVFLDGPDSYVVWMKNNEELLQRYPPEDKTENEAAQHIPIEGPFGPDCDVVPYPDPTSLKLTDVDEHDEGFYQCMVHFQASSAMEFIIELRLVESPGAPKILDEDGFNVSGSVVTLPLSGNMSLICDIDDALDKPRTFLRWERNGREIARVGKVNDGVLRTIVHIVNATRDEHCAHYVCLSQNSDVTEPLMASIVIQMTLPPKSVEIRLNNNPNFEMGEPRVVDCVVVGSVPPPSVAWLLGDSMLKPSLHKEIHNGDYTLSSLTLSPSTRDDKTELICRAYNPYFEKDIFEDKVVINVGSRPTCVNEHEEVVGYVAGQVEDVTCTVEAYPKPMQIGWTFADTTTRYTNVKPVPGYQNRYTSTLTWIAQDRQQGELLCRAFNHVGEQEEPCSFPIVAGGPPAMPSCETTIDLDPEAMKIFCNPGWDGGRQQTIHLELLRNGNTIQKISSAVGIFALPLKHDGNVTAIVYATNSRGRSDTIILPLQPEDTEIKEEQEKAQVPSVPIYKTRLGAILIEALAGCILAAMFVWLMSSYLNGRRSPPPSFTAATADVEACPMTSDGSYRRQPPIGMTVPQQFRVGSQTIMRVSGASTCYTGPTKAGRVLGFSAPSRVLEMISDSDTEREQETYFV